MSEQPKWMGVDARPGARVGNLVLSGERVWTVWLELLGGRSIQLFPGWYELGELEQRTRAWIAGVAALDPKLVAATKVCECALAESLANSDPDAYIEDAVDATAAALKEWEALP